MAMTQRSVRRPGPPLPTLDCRCGRLFRTRELVGTLKQKMAQARIGDMASTVRRAYVITLDYDTFHIYDADNDRDIPMAPIALQGWLDIHEKERSGTERLTSERRWRGADLRNGRVP